MQTIDTEVEVTLERSVKHSHLYKGKDFGGIYVPKQLIGHQAPAKLWGRVSTTPTKEVGGER